MEAQAAAQKLAAQHVAQAALRGLQGGQEHVKDEHHSHEELPTDLTLDAEEKALRMRERLEREQQQQQRQHLQDEQHRDREPLQQRQFDFRHLIPQVPIKTE